MILDHTQGIKVKRVRKADLEVQRKMIRSITKSIIIINMRRRGLSTVEAAPQKEDIITEVEENMTTAQEIVQAALHHLHS